MRNVLTLLPIFAALATAGCSAVKAADKTGAEIDSVAACRTVACFQAQPTMETLASSDVGDADRYYRFRYQRRQGSILRAVGYGLAGVYTLGISELVTNPAENAMQNDRMFVVDAVCTIAAEDCHTVLVTLPGEETRMVRGDPEALREARSAAPD